ncbi:MAG: hypothetical protein N3B11_07775 [Coriobacteriia bacterium]|nr:hypothetical protein [Coriobacteriia bacterium]
MKKWLIVACIVTVLVIPAAAGALEQYGAAFWKQWDGPVYYNYGMVYFFGGVRATGDYGTVPGKTIKQAYVRLIEGSWDSGRCYTAVGPSTPDGRLYSRTIRKAYNPLAVCYGYYGWLYY